MDQRAGSRGLDEPSEAETSRLRRSYLLALTYPLWHLAAPEGARDAWWVWWVVASPFAVVAGLSLASDAVARQLRHLFPLCGWLLTAHLFALAALNGMQPFYVVASVLVVISTGVLIRSRFDLLAYGTFVMTIAAVLYWIAPSVTKLVYWGGLLTIMPLLWVRLDYQLRREKLTQAMAKELEARVEVRTRELQQANERLQTEILERERLEGQLRFAHKMEVLGRVAGGMAHDFNNFLTTVGVYAELVIEGLPERSTLRQDAAQIRKTVRQASALTEQLLALSRRGAADARVLDMNDLVVEASSMLRHLLPAHIEVDLRLHAAPSQVRVDPDQLIRVLMNLILNARDAMPGGGRLILETGICGAEELPEDVPRPAGEDGYVLLAVTDTGAGMDAETREHAFEPFFTRKQGDHGTGLGLSIVYGILEQSRGHVRLWSEPGEGTRIELYWPRARETEVGAEESAPHDPSAVGKGSERILLVEDEPDLREALDRVLRSHGYDVVGASDGDQALTLAEDGRERFDLLVSDVVMPRMSGLELAERFRSRHPETCVLLVSGQLGHPSVAEQAFPQGVAFLPKPFTPVELSTKIRSVLESARRG